MQVNKGVAMNTNDFTLKKMMSTRRAEILNGLRQIKANRDNPPQGQVLYRAIELLRSQDADVREEAVAALGLHWQCKEAFPILLDMLKGHESDQVVLEIAARAVAAYAQIDSHDKELALRALSLVVLNVNYDPELRGIAYLGAERLADKITDAQWAQMKEDIEKLEVDWSWLRACAN